MSPSSPRKPRQIMLRSILVTLGVSVVTCWFVFLAHGWYHASLLPALGVSVALGDALGTLLAMMAALVGQLVVSRTLFNDEMFGVAHMQTRMREEREKMLPKQTSGKKPRKRRSRKKSSSSSIAPSSSATDQESS